MEGNSYTTDTEAEKFGFTYPVGYRFEKITELRANRMVYTHKSKLNQALNRMVYSYNNGLVEGYMDTEYVTPNLIKNLVTNSTFKSTSGWIGSYVSPIGVNDNKGSVYNAEVEVVVYDETGKTLIESF
jgi:hypothetical protein